MEPALALLVAAAPTDCVDVWPIDEVRLGVDLTVHRPWAERLFQLEVCLEEGALSVRERACSLPQYCPERHIVEGGRFCLGLDAGPPQIADQARQWWLSLILYLELQMNADHAGTWPEAYAWRHGSAWRPQAVAEMFLKNVSPRLREDIQAGRVRLLDERGRPLFWFRAGKLEGQVPRLSSEGRRARPITRRERERHRLQMQVVALAIEDMVVAEKRFWAAAKAAGHTCCGTMKNCPLAADQDKERLEEHRRPIQGTRSGTPGAAQ